MIPELGHFALVLALALALIQSIVPAIGARKRDRVLMQLADSTAFAQFAFVATSFAALTVCYVTSDFSVAFGDRPVCRCHLPATACPVVRQKV